MGTIKWDVLGYAILAAASLSGFGIAIGERSIAIALLSALILYFSLRAGFSKKKREAQKNTEGNG